MVNKVLIERLESGDQGTFGRLIAGDLVLFSLELPWRENKPDISCIPAGSYLCKWTYSPRFQRFMYLVDGAPGRAGVRFHKANLAGDLLKGFRSHLNGCVALGEKLGWIQKQKAVLLSAPAMRRFETLMNGRPFELEIKYHGLS